MEIPMKPGDLLVRCYATKTDGQWVAVSLEFGLAAQADTLDEVKAKLDAQIREYVNDALGEDREHASYLLRRRAPLVEHVKYHMVRMLSCWARKVPNGPANGKRELFVETLHLQSA